MPRHQTTDPHVIKFRFQALKKALLISNQELAELFGVHKFTLIRWARGSYAPQLKYQRELERLERAHGLRE